MSKTLLWLLAAIVVIAAAIAVFSNGGEEGSEISGNQVGNQAQEMEAEHMEEEAMVSSEDEDFIGSMRALMARGEAMTCTFAQNTPETGDMKGSIYVHGERLRADFSSQHPEFGSSESSVINDGSVGYTWGSNPQGSVAVKFALSPDQDSRGESGSVDFDQELNFKCRKWSVDEAKFSPPSDIKFMDFSGTLQ